MKAFQMYPTIITPYQADGAIDYEALEKLIALFAQVGCDGVFAVCQSSEMFFLNDEEKLELAEKSLALCRKYQLKCVISGHTQDSLEDQIAYLKALEKLNPDAIILVSNRLAAQDEGDEIALPHLKAICDALAPETRLGIYECPYPYKRPLTEALLQGMMEDGRFSFVKDTCCKRDEIKSRLEKIQGSSIELFNANAATLLESMDDGALGYSGIMLNMMPEFFTLFKQAWNQNDRPLLEKVAQYISFTSVIEYQNYPRNAKFMLMQRDILKTTETRTGKPPLTESQMKELLAFIDVNNAVYAQLKG